MSFANSNSTTAQALTATEVVKSYQRGSLALDGVSLAVRQGTITGLVGPNGAGKSTLIKAWLGIEKPSRGQVRVLGIDPWRNRSAALERIGYVPQTPSLYRNLSVGDHLAFASSARRTFDRGLAQVRLAQLGIDQRSLCGALSGGQRAQVSLALALGTRAPVLLLDEPLANLDPLARRQFLHVLVDDVRANGTTALLTSHVVTDVAQACDQLVVLAAGHKLLDEGIAAALDRHRLVMGVAESVDVVASFPDAAGRVVTLLSGSSIGRPATLEEVVIGYLATARVESTGGEPISAVRTGFPIIGATLTDRLIDFDHERGEPIVVGTGTAVADILTELAAEEHLAEFLRGHPDLSSDEVRASLRYAALLIRGGTDRDQA